MTVDRRRVIVDRRGVTVDRRGVRRLVWGRGLQQRAGGWGEGAVGSDEESLAQIS